MGTSVSPWWAVQAAATVSTDLRGGGMSRALRWAAAARSAARHLRLPTNVTVIVGGGALTSVGVSVCVCIQN
jgi:hypothetical protein